VHGRERRRALRVEAAPQGLQIHRLVPHFVARSGNFVANDGNQNESAYGPKFEGGKLSVRHGGPDAVSMANAGRSSNGRHVAFGRMIKGMDTAELVSVILI
jgi:cyclophilin family peptidyl-prolyl cis-trans isomerase